jgi:hypothetical protein
MNYKIVFLDLCMLAKVLGSTIKYLILSTHTRIAATKLLKNHETANVYAKKMLLFLKNMQEGAD